MQMARFLPWSGSSLEVEEELTDSHLMFTVRSQRPGYAFA